MIVRDAKLFPKRETWGFQTMWNILGSPIKQQGKTHSLETCIQINISLPLHGKYLQCSFPINGCINCLIYFSQYGKLEGNKNQNKYKVQSGGNRFITCGSNSCIFLPKNVTEGVVGKSSPTASYVMVNQSISTEPCTVTCRENYFCCLWTTFKLIYFRLSMLVVHPSSGKCV